MPIYLIYARACELLFDMIVNGVCVLYHSLLILIRPPYINLICSYSFLAPLKFSDILYPLAPKAKKKKKTSVQIDIITKRTRTICSTIFGLLWVFKEATYDSLNHVSFIITLVNKQNCTTTDAACSISEKKKAVYFYRIVVKY